MEKIRFLPFTIVLLLGLCRCTPINFITTVFQPTPTIMPASIWIQSWLKNEPGCQMPCWQGITPGETSMDEAFAIVRKMDDVTDLSHFLSDDREDILEIYWRFADGGGGTITTQNDGMIVNSIYLRSDPNQTITLDQVIESYGDPDSVILADCRGDFSFTQTCAVIFVYLDSGMVIETGLLKNEKSSEGNRVQIENNTRIDSIVLIVPTEEGFQERFGGAFSDYGCNYQPWKGYGAYP